MPSILILQNVQYICGTILLIGLKGVLNLEIVSNNGMKVLTSLDFIKEKEHTLKFFPIPDKSLWLLLGSISFLVIIAFQLYHDSYFGHVYKMYCIGYK